jgi:hypothetical protein
MCTVLWSCLCVVLNSCVIFLAIWYLIGSCWKWGIRLSAVSASKASCLIQNFGLWCRLYFRPLLSKDISLGVNWMSVLFATRGKKVCFWFWGGGVESVNFLICLFSFLRSDIWFAIRGLAIHLLMLKLCENCFSIRWWLLSVRSITVCSIVSFLYIETLSHLVNVS